MPWFAGMMGMDGMGMGGMEDMWRTMYEGMRQMYERGGDAWGQQAGTYAVFHTEKDAFASSARVVQAANVA